MYNGLLLIDKPAGFTSHDVCAKLRGMLRMRRIGHAGTLDPMATGLLVVLLGAATKAGDWVSGHDKEYIAALRLGIETDTQDVSGTVLCKRAVDLDEDAVKAAILSFLGRRRQLPPMYSAVKQDGQPLYKAARKGKTIDRATRAVDFKQIEYLGKTGGDYRFRVLCSKGTYIRTLCHDIGQKLGAGGCMASLCRTRAGDFSLEQALTLERVQQLCQSGGLAGALLGVDTLFSHLPAVTVAGQGLVRARNGAALSQEHLSDGELPQPGGLCRVYAPDGAFLMLGEVRETGDGRMLWCKKMFAG